MSEVVRSDEPAVGKGDVLVKVQLCGVCASELYPWLGDNQPYPRKLGHEVAGVVEAVGEDVRTFRPGMRVTGLFYQGFAEYVVAPEKYVVEVPAGLTWSDTMGEPLGCVVSAARRTHVEPGDTVAIIGLGFMGLLMLQLLSQKAPSRLIAIDIREEALQNACRFGASETYQPKEVPEKMLLNEWKHRHEDRGVDVVVEASGSQAGLTLAGNMMRQHGVLSILGYHQGGTRSIDMALWNWKALGVINAHERRDWFLLDCIKRGLALTAVDKLRIAPLVSHQYSLDEVDQAFHALHLKPSTFLKAVVTL